MQFLPRIQPAGEHNRHTVEISLLIFTRTLRCFWRYPGKTAIFSPVPFLSDVSFWRIWIWIGIDPFLFLFLPFLFHQAKEALILTLTFSLALH